MATLMMVMMHKIHLVLAPLTEGPEMKFGVKGVLFSSSANYSNCCQFAWVVLAVCSLPIFLSGIWICLCTSTWTWCDSGLITGWWCFQRKLEKYQLFWFHIVAPLILPTKWRYTNYFTYLITYLITSNQVSLVQTVCHLGLLIFRSHLILNRNVF